MGAVLTRKKVSDVKPFLKWAGGKGQLIPTIKANYPKELSSKVGYKFKG